jgi:hypothetical protein
LSDVSFGALSAPLRKRRRFSNRKGGGIFSDIPQFATHSEQINSGPDLLFFDTLPTPSSARVRRTIAPFATNVTISEHHASELASRAIQIEGTANESP